MNQETKLKVIDRRADKNNLLFYRKLQESFEDRCRKNPRYSLRSFALQLNLSPATLSGLLNGKRNPSLQMVEKIGVALGLSSVEIISQKKDILGWELAKADEKFTQLDQDTFSLISDWYHLAILELMKLKSFEPNARWISNQLKVNLNQIKIAMDRLIRLGILEIKKDGTWHDRSGGFTSHYRKGRTTEARKMYQLQLLEKSIESVKQDDFKIRDHSSMTLAIDSENIDRAKDEIEKFRRKFSSKLEDSNRKNAVYQLQISFFPITRERDNS